MIAEWLLVSTTGLVCYAVGRVWQAVHQVNADNAREKTKKKADEVCDQLPELGPYAFDAIVFYPKGHVAVSCPKCPWASHWKNGKGGWMAICACAEAPKDHFHHKCGACGTRKIILAREDIDERITKATARPAITRDPNACVCGAVEATTSVDGQWKCMKCGELRPKLVGGVTPHAN